MSVVNEIHAPYIHGHSMFQLYDAPWVTLDWSLAQHDHQSAEGAGQLTDAALSAPVSIAKGGTGLSAVVGDDRPLFSNGTGYEGGPILQTGTYVPTITGTSNILGTPAPNTFNWMRIGDHVMVTGQIPGVQSNLAAATLTELFFSLPIDPTNNFVDAQELNGNSANAQTQESGNVAARTGTKDGRIFWQSQNAATFRGITVAFQYRLNG